MPNNSKMVQARALFTMADQMVVSRVSSVKWPHFQWPWTTPSTNFKVTPLFDAEYLRNGTRYRQFQWTTNRDLHTPYSTV